MSSPDLTILIVEDDVAIASGLELNLNLEGFRSIVVNDGEGVADALTEHQPTLMLLDISLPKKNGLEVLREMRAAGDATPVIVLSARQNEFDKVAALRLGADDYVTKPFSIAELLARIDAMLRRVGPTAAVTGGTAERLTFSNVVVDLATRQVSCDGEAVSLTHLEFELLTFLIRHPERVFSREQLLQSVWGIQHVGSPRTVDNFIRQLRAKLEELPNRPKHILTVRGNGYRFIR